MPKELTKNCDKNMFITLTKWSCGVTNYDNPTSPNILRLTLPKAWLVKSMKSGLWPNNNTSLSFVVALEWPSGHALRYKENRKKQNITIYKASQRYLDS